MVRSEDEFDIVVLVKVNESFGERSQLRSSITLISKMQLLPEALASLLEWGSTLTGSEEQLQRTQATKHPISANVHP